jgi:D-amino-acid oxidase
MAASRFKVAVVGCGVAGLTSAIRLLEQGFEVTILARETPPRTTSDVAAAFWAPTILMSPARVAGWSLISHRTFQELAQEPVSGITLKPLFELFEDDVSLPEAWQILDEVEAIRPGLFPEIVQGGYRLIVPAIDTPVYMPFLVQRFKERGGSLVQTPVASLKTLHDQYPLVVNCTGVGANQLVPDSRVYPIRGQVVRVRKPANLKPEIIHYNTASTTTYIVPRSGDCLLGGTYEDGNWSLEPDMATAQAIIDRCSIFNPELRQADIIEHRVGLRPGRPFLRLELERTGGCALIHNYGHGSVGHTLSWGCAAEVARLAQAFREEAGG